MLPTTTIDKECNKQIILRNSNMPNKKTHLCVQEYFVIDIVIFNFMISVNSKHGLYFAPNR